jgi:hypothetical protein
MKEWKGNHFCLLLLSFDKILSKAQTGASNDNETTKDKRYDAQVCPKKIMT